ncbi:unnamed protein product, partial [Discosporangium mesarthrocarpum]
MHRHHSSGGALEGGGGRELYMRSPRRPSSTASRVSDTMESVYDLASTGRAQTPAIPPLSRSCSPVLSEHSGGSTGTVGALGVGGGGAGLGLGQLQASSSQP